MGRGGGGRGGLKVLIQKESGEEIGCGCKLEASRFYLFLTSLHTVNYIDKSFSFYLFLTTLHT